MMKNKVIASVVSGGMMLASGQASSIVIEEVVVTAQKREQSSNDVGMAINAFTGDTLNKLGVNDTTDLSNIVPGFTFAESGYTTPIYTLRGVGFNDSSPQSSSTVGVYHDQIAVAFPIMTRGPVMDIERVEVMKGPQGTLFGRNTTGGAIDYVANKPGLEFEAGLIGTVGNYESKEVEGFISNPINDQVRARLAFKTSQSDKGWQKSATRNERLGERDKTGIRAIFEFDISSDVTALLNLGWWEDRSDTQAPQAVGMEIKSPGIGGDAITPYLSDLNAKEENEIADWTIGTRPSLDMSSTSVNLSLNWQINDDIKFTSLTGISTFDDDGSVYNRDGVPGFPSADADIYAVIPTASLDNGYLPPAYLANGGWETFSDIEAFSQELRFSGESESLIWVGGIYYSQDEVKSVRLIDLGLTSNTNFGTLDNPLGFQAWGMESLQESESWSIFGNTEWILTPALSLTVGARYSEDEKDFDACSFDILGDAAPLFGAERGGCLLSDLDTGERAIRAVKELNEDSLSGKIGLNYQHNDDHLLYASYSKGFKSGGFPLLSATSVQQFEPATQEELNAWEAGFKSSLFDSSAQLNGSVFLYDYKDKQLNTSLLVPPWGSLARLANVPESTVQGAEFDLQIQPMEGLFVSLAASYTETEVKELIACSAVCTAPGDLSGSEFPFTPKVQASAIVNYEWPINAEFTGFVGGDISYSGSRKTDYSNENFPLDPINDLPGYTLLGLQGGFRNETIDVTFWAKNVTDEFYATNTNRPFDTHIRFNGMPRTFGVTLSYNWY
jgi:iron complex outermembrane receptor protein